MTDNRTAALGRLQWTEPRRDTQDRGLHPLATPTVARRLGVPPVRSRRAALSEYLSRTPYPRWPGATSALEEATGLLQAAAEIEHALLVQYLYAGYFLESESTIRGIFVDIARQEMAHFINVNNLLLLLGKRPHFQRDALLPGSAFDPLPFALLPPTESRLADIVSIEAPDLELLEKASPQMAARLKAALAKRSKPGETHRVGALYAVIEWLFMHHQAAPAEPGLPSWELAETDFHAGAERFQAGVIWQQNTRNVVVSVSTDRDTALGAIRQISMQGESFDVQDIIDSHFEIFLQTFEAVSQQKPVLLPIAQRPNTLPAPSADPMTEEGRITETKTLAWAKVVNKRYQMLLVLLPIHMSVATDDASQVGTLRDLAVTWAFDEMRTLRSATTDHLAGMPIKPGSAVMAGPPFELDAVDLTGDLTALIKALSALQDQCKTIIQGLLAGPASFPEKVYLKNLIRRDDERRAIINPIVTS